MENLNNDKSYSLRYTDEASFSAHENKAVTGQFDDDSYDEIAVVSRDEAGSASLSIVDTFNDATNGPTTVVIATALEFEADFFDLAKGDFDGDKRDELLLVLGKTNSTPIWHIIKWNENSDSYELV